MKKILCFVLTALFVLNSTAYAYDAYSVFFTGHNTEAQKGIIYIDTLLKPFADRYVVEKTRDVDISEIDKFYEELSKPLTVEELDNGKSDFDFSKIASTELKRKTEFFKTLGGLSGYKAEFVPLVSYKVYRNISVVGGFTVYEKTHTDPYEAYWQCVCTIEDLTKEIVNYNARMKLVEKVRNLNDMIDNDNSLKIFILVDGKINSFWEKG